MSRDKNDKKNIPYPGTTETLQQDAADFTGTETLTFPAEPVCDDETEVLPDECALRTETFADLPGTETLTLLAEDICDDETETLPDNHALSKEASAETLQGGDFTAGTGPFTETFTETNVGTAADTETFADPSTDDAKEAAAGDETETLTESTVKTVAGTETFANPSPGTAAVPETGSATETFTGNSVKTDTGTETFKDAYPAAGSVTPGIPVGSRQEPPAPSPSDDLKKGTTLAGTYTIKGKIGSGGGGDVYKAYHERLQTDVAVKKIKERIRGRLNDRAEADILKKMKHTYLCSLRRASATDAVTGGRPAVRTATSEF